MTKDWTFGQKIALGFAIIIVLTFAKSSVSVYSLRSVVAAKDQVISINAQNILDAERLADIAARRVAAVRGYFLTKQDQYLQELTQRREQFQSILARLRERTSDPEGLKLLDDVDAKETDYRTTSDPVIAMKRADASMEAIIERFDEEVVPRRNVMQQAIDTQLAYYERVLEREKQAATQTASFAVTLVILLAFAIVALGIGVAAVLTRTLGRQIGTSVAQVQNASAELQAAANQQSTSAKETATAMNEITTTISELLATSRQISESAQRVVQIAGQTATAARSGDSTVEKGSDAVAGIRRQVDLIVTHMLELGKKSQQIGAVLDILGELAEQTNILAINATIEAAGAGEAGKRFTIVAEEIRKLADRVGNSTKQVRGLIEDVRSAVNTTVMTTESGAKAVETGSKQFTEVALAFQHIAGLVGTTTEAAKEIGLSTKQQTSAVEQVNVAIVNAAQATKETESSSGQTLRTASELSSLSRDLLRLVRPDTAPSNHHATTTM